MAAPISTVGRVGAIPQGAAMEDDRGMFPNQGGWGYFAVKGRAAARVADWPHLGHWLIHIYKLPFNYFNSSYKFPSPLDEFPETLKRITH